MSHAKVIIRERIKSLPKKIKEGLKYEGNIYNILMENAFDIPLWLKEKKEKERTKVIQKEQKINKKMICKWLKWITLFKLLLHMNKRKNKEVGKKVSGVLLWSILFSLFLSSYLLLLLLGHTMPKPLACSSHKSTHISWIPNKISTYRL